MVPSFEGQLLSVLKEIVFLRGRPEFKDVNEIANLLLQPARSSKKRRLNDGQHLDTGQKGREEEEEEVISQRCLTGNFKCFNQVARALMEVETRLGAQLSPSQRQFVIVQSKKNGLVAVGRKRKRTPDEESLFRILQNKITNGKRDMEDYDERLLIKLPGKAGAERQSERKKKRTKEEVEQENSNERVRLVGKRAGGLSAERMSDVRAGKKKNKDTSVFSGDALRTKEITEGTFIVEALTGGRDSLGALGNFSCNHCGALRFCQICQQIKN